MRLNHLSEDILSSLLKLYLGTLRNYSVSDFYATSTSCYSYFRSRISLKLATRANGTSSTFIT